MAANAKTKFFIIFNTSVTSQQRMHNSARTANASPPRFLLLGDSLVAGYNWQQRFPAFGVRNCGVPGATTQELLTTLPRLKRYHSSARLIMVMIGTNDLVMEQYGFTEELHQIMVLLTRSYPGAELLVNSLLPIQLPHLGRDTVSRVNTIIETLCQQTGSCYVDVHARFQKTEGHLFQADNIHLTSEGYELWARTVLEHVAFLLEND